MKMVFKIDYRDLTGIRRNSHQTTKADEGSQEYRKIFLRNSDYFQKNGQITGILSFNQD